MQLLSNAQRSIATRNSVMNISLGKPVIALQILGLELYQHTADYIGIETACRQFTIQLLLAMFPPDKQRESTLFDDIDSQASTFSAAA